jgi:threonine-phosphate decarboxylase
MSQAFHGGRLSEAAREFGLSQDAFIDFSANTNVLAPVVPPAEWEKWRAQITRYPEADARSLRDQLACLHGVNADYILPTGGAIEALYLAARLFARCKIGIIEPAFSDYHRAFQAGGCEPERIVLARVDWHAPISAWEHMLDPFDVVVLGNPNNPTGALQTRKEWLAVLEKPWPRPKTWLLDEAFMEFVADHEQETLLPILSEYPSLIVLRSLTKSWRIPGLRLGFLVTSNAAWMERLRIMQPPWSINAVAQAWSAEYLTPANHAQLLAGLRGFEKTKDRFEAGLSRIAGLRIYPSAANFLLVELLDSSLDASRVCRELGRRGLLVRVCDSFHGIPKGRFIRVAVRTEEDNNLLARELAAICIALNRRAA